MAGAIRVGVAGWDYPDWKGVLYPAPRPRGFDPLRFLAHYLPLVEINSTLFRRGAGRDARYDYLYPPEELEPWVERAESVAREPGTRAVDVVFNNHYRAQAVVNALQFQALLDGAPPPAPPDLVEHYADQLLDCTLVTPAPPFEGDDRGR